MEISQQKLNDAVTAKIITPEQALLLEEFMQLQSQSSPRLNVTHVLYYFGGCLAIAAMTLFMGLGWDTFGGAGIVAIAAIYAAIGLTATKALFSRGMQIPAGICATFVVCLAPVLAIGLQQWLGLWPKLIEYGDGSGHMLALELSTLCVGALMLWRYKSSFIVLPIALACWSMALNGAGFMLGNETATAQRELVSICIGLVMVVSAVCVDLRTRAKPDYTFWLYSVGALVFWGGLSWYTFDYALPKLVYFLINLLLIAVGVLLSRRIFVVLGALGSFGYLNYLAFSVFRDSGLFVIALAAIGLSIIYLGILWQKKALVITARLQRILPKAISEQLKKARS